MKPVYRILLVDDDPGDLHLLRHAITDGRPHVHVNLAQSREEAESRLLEADFDCVVLDFNLGSCKADEFLPIIRKLRPDCASIVVSGSDEQRVVIECMRHGSVDFVHKDEITGENTLWDRVEVVVANRRHQLLQKERRKRRERRLFKMTEGDPLTGLANRRRADRILKCRRWRLEHSQLSRTSVIMFDLDHFKQINDTEGHECGDQVLQAVADLIRTCTTNADIACRWGGEEFLIIRPATSLANGVYWAERLRSNLGRLIVHFNEKAIRTTASFGVVNVTHESLNNEAITRADQAMYLAKRRGRDRVCTWEMVAMTKLVGDVVNETPLERLKSTLDHSWSKLGPTQREHLSSHSQDVSDAAVRIGKTLGMPQDDLERLRFAGLCHDLGKFAIPEEILAKPSRLSRDEVTLVGHHAADGAEITNDLGADEQTADYVRFHHSRFDKPSQNIPLGARVLSVADAFVSMTTCRPYQSARSLRGALEELHRQRGRQFDPSVVDAALTTFGSHDHHAEDRLDKKDRSAGAYPRPTKLAYSEAERP